jgi:hypothetical protein
MYAYADQNFLSNCADNREWRDAVIGAKNQGTATLVLSPWHFYELGNARAELRDGLLQLVEDARPSWTFTHADMQKRECLSVWNDFWGDGGVAFQPICTLREVAAALHNVLPEQLMRLNLRDWVAAFAAGPDALVEFRDSLTEQTKASASNQQDYQRGRMTKRLLEEVDKRHVAVQLSRAKYDRPKASREVYADSEALRRTQPLGTMIDMFVYWQGTANLKTYQTESALTENIWDSDAKLPPNRLIDRLHATVALPHCHRFVTDDRDLAKRCEAAKKALKFPTAEVQKGEAFIRSL